jgi:hypothetical protein
MIRTLIDQVVEAVLIRPMDTEEDEVVRVRTDSGVSFDMKVSDDVPYTGQLVRVQISWGDDYECPVVNMASRRQVG